MEIKKLKSNLLTWIFVYYCMVMINVIVYYNLIDFPKLIIRKGIHKSIIDGTACTPHQYRILVPYLAEFLQRMGIYFKESYVIIRAMADLLGAILFHIYLKKWFTTKVCVIGVLFYLGILPLVYPRSYFQSIDSLNFLFFLIGYILIRERKDIFLFPLLFISMFNRETSIILILVYLFFRFDELNIKQLGINVFLLFIISMGTYFGIRSFYETSKPYSDFFYFFSNLKSPLSYIYTILLFNIFLFYAWYDFGNKPKFLRRSSLMIPFFLIIHWMISIVQEIRLFLPLIPIVIPLGLISMFGIEKKEKETDIPQTNSFLTIRCHFGFIGFCLIFIMLFYLFCYYNVFLYYK